MVIHYILNYYFLLILYNKNKYCNISLYKQITNHIKLLSQFADKTLVINIDKSFILSSGINLDKRIIKLFTINKLVVFTILIIEYTI